MASSEESTKLGLLPCVAILTGGCIGSAIFSISGMTMYYAGPAVILTWIVAGLILGLYGIMVAELAVRYPRSGGVFVFPAKALGPGWGFVAAWGFLISNCIAVAFSAIYVATYLGVGFPILSGLQIPLAIAAILLVTLLNLWSFTAAGKLNNVLVGILVATMVVYGVIAFAHPNFNWGNFSDFFGGAMGTFGWIQAVPNAMLAYGAVVAIAFMVAEVKNPNRTVPRSMAISLVVVILLYLLMIVGTLGHVTTQYLIDNPGMRYIPMFAAAWTSMGDIPWLSKLISISAFIALITTMLVVQAMNARALCSMAEDKMLPGFLAKINKYGAPSASTLVLAAGAVILSCFPGFTELLVNLGSITAVVTIVIVCLALWQARRKTPHVEGDYKAPGGQALVWFTVILITVCYIPAIFNGGAAMWIFTAIIYAIGALIMVYYRRKGRSESVAQE